MLDIWDSIHDLLGFRRPGSVLHLLGLGRLHCTATAVIWSLCSKMLCLLLQLGCTYTFRLSRALIRDSDSATWCQDSASLYDSFNSWASTATKAAPSLMTSPDLSQCQVSASLHDPFIPSEPLSPGRLLYVTKFGASMRHDLGQPWNPASMFWLRESPSQQIFFQ